LAGSTQEQTDELFAEKKNLRTLRQSEQAAGRCASSTALFEGFAIERTNHSHADLYRMLFARTSRTVATAKSRLRLIVAALLLAASAALLTSYCHLRARYPRRVDYFEVYARSETSADGVISRKLLPGMAFAERRYLLPEDKDFVALFAR
jgi:hypothetical protein